jgi:hypothetical protein
MWYRTGGIESGVHQFLVKIQTVILCDSRRAWASAARDKVFKSHAPQGALAMIITHNSHRLPANYDTGLIRSFTSERG